MKEPHTIVAIGRQVGSGGATIGKRLAENLGFHYLDREIITITAQHLKVSEENLEAIEERAYSIWQTLLQATSYDARFMLADYYLPTGKRLFDTQSQVIRQAAADKDCVVVGRCATHLFRRHPQAARIFLYADPEIRLQSVARRFQLDEEKARKTMEQLDKERDRYYQTFTGHRRQDIGEYDLALDTGKIGLEAAIDVLSDYLHFRFPHLKTSTF